MQAYCIYCRSKTNMMRAKVIKMKNGKRAALGVCSQCGNIMFRVSKVRNASGTIRAS